MNTTTEPVNWNDPRWGHNPVHVAAWAPDAHDDSEAVES